MHDSGSNLIDAEGEKNVRKSLTSRDQALELAKTMSDLGMNLLVHGVVCIDCSMLTFS